MEFTRIRQAMNEPTYKCRVSCCLLGAFNDVRKPHYCSLDLSSLRQRR